MVGLEWYLCCRLQPATHTHTRIHVYIYIHIHVHTYIHTEANGEAGSTYLPFYGGI